VVESTLPSPPPDIPQLCVVPSASAAGLLVHDDGFTLGAGGVYCAGDALTHNYPAAFYPFHHSEVGAFTAIGSGGADVVDGVV